MTIQSITDLDVYVRTRLDEIAAAIREAQSGEVLTGEMPQRYDRLLSYATAAAHAFPVERVPQTADAICNAIDKERDRRIDGGFDHNGHRYQSRPSDRENVLGSAQLAFAAIGQGAQVGDYRWANPDADFEWILADNSKVAMDAFDVVALFQAGVAFKALLTFYARGLKDTVLAEADPTTVDIVIGWPQ